MSTADLVLSLGPSLEIGRDGGLWRYDKTDMEIFVRVRKLYRTVVMGRKTYLTLPKKILAEHRVVVFTSQKIEGVECSEDIDTFHAAQTEPYLVIGGAQIYRYYLAKPEMIGRVYLTRFRLKTEPGVSYLYDAESFPLPQLEGMYRKTREVGDFYFTLYSREKMYYPDVHFIAFGDKDLLFGREVCSRFLHLT